MRERNRPSRVSDILQLLFKQHPIEKRLREGKIWSVWEEAVGQKIATKAYPAKFNDGILTVNVSSSPWLQQLSFLKEEIRNNLNRLLEEELISEIFLKSGHIRREEIPRKDPEKPARALSEEELATIEAHTANIQDEALRESFQRLFRKNIEEK